ncbi:MAG: glycoside hydrolase family protein [Candidatus Cloacimonetes bacterium]|jgi:lysozyme|nr:glycoside hydrolase family protein [Candidatus Cloacimonadota bacterium]
MEATLLERIKEQLIRHEGLRLKPYRCTAGKLSIGIGRNLDDCGISQTEAYVLLENDIQNCEKQILDEIPEIYNGLDEVRKSVLLNMCFNLGIGGLLEFNNTLAFIAAGDWERAANGMLASKWAKQVGRRAIELSELMRKGK